MKKRILFAVLGVLVVIAVLGGVKVLQIRTMIDHGKKAVLPPDTVTTFTARPESWETSLSAVGSLTAVQGVTVAAELPAKVVEIAFEPGAKVKQGDLLIRQDTSVEEAQLPGAEAQVVRLYHLEGKSYHEISSTVGMPENSIGPILSRARNKMRRAGVS